MRYACLTSIGLTMVLCAPAPAGGGREIAVTYRDFTGTDTTAELSNPPADHPDFENEDAFCWNVVNQAPAFCGGREIGVIPELGIVATALGGDGKPVYLGGDMDTTTGADNFASWFNDNSTYNTTLGGTLLLGDNGDGTFTYETDRFFPVDGLGFGNTLREVSQLPLCQPPLQAFCGIVFDVSTEDHNWHFTMEMHTEFTYTGGEVFDYEGDDDLWVFIDGRLVIDIGGVHNPLARSIGLDGLVDVNGAEVPLEIGESYAFDLFFAERHRNESNFRVTTSILIGALPCGADIDGDGVVAVADLLAVLGEWGQTVSDADINDDGIVDVADLLIVLAGWGDCPG